MKRLILAGLALAFGAVSQAATVTYNPATGVLLYPVNFFEINSNLIVAAISGAFPGTGSGNASTNVAQGWSASQTFNGPLFMGTTNVASKISSLESSVGGKQAADSDLDDLSDGSLTGSKVGSGIDDDNVSFDDADGVWTATTIGAALEELNDSINSGVPNGTGAKVHWSELLGVPAGFADGTDDGAGGGIGVQTNQNNAYDTPYTQTFNGPLVVNGPASLNGTTDVAILRPGTVVYGGKWPIANGGTDADTYTEARTNLHVVPDLHVMAYYLSLLQINAALSGTGHVPRRISSGIITNMTVDDAALALLAATTAAGQRAALGGGVPSIAGDTFTGPVLVPYLPFNWEWTNNAASNNAAISRRAAAEQFHLLSVGGAFFSGVDPDKFTNNNGVLEFAPEATVGVGKVVLESAVAGGTQAISNQVDAAISNPVLDDTLKWDGSQWANKPSGQMFADTWYEFFNGLFASGTGAYTPFTTVNINSGAILTSTSYNGRQGVVRLTSRPSSASQWTGEHIGLGITQLIPTNTIQWLADIILFSTNAVALEVGMYDDVNTNAPTDAVMMTITNQVARVEAYAGGSQTRGSLSFSLQTNVFYRVLGYYTNGANAKIEIYTNRTMLAWSDSLSSGLPRGESQVLGFGVRAISTGAASTNGTEIAGVDNLGMRYSVPNN